MEEALARQGEGDLATRTRKAVEDLRRQADDMERRAVISENLREEVRRQTKEEEANEEEKRRQRGKLKEKLTEKARKTRK